jgi:hypothetical protein
MWWPGAAADATPGIWPLLSRRCFTARSFGFLRVFRRVDRWLSALIPHGTRDERLAELWPAPAELEEHARPV